ncbi:MAG: hypothetical protein ACXVBE_09605 [Bdellovibrionota bacterium]
MKNFLFITILLSLTSLTAHAEGHQVFGIKSDFPMNDGQTLFRDVYVNLGTSQGVKIGSSLDVFRTITTVDEINQRVGQNISFKIGRLKVIHAEGNVAVARVDKMLPPEQTPTGSYTNVMVGDQVEISNK